MHTIDRNPHAMISRFLFRLVAALFCLAILRPGVLDAQPVDEPELVDPAWPSPDSNAADGVVYDRLRRLMADRPKARRRAAKALQRADPGALVPLVDAYFFMANEARTDARPVLEHLSNERLGGRWRDWFVHVGGRTDLEAPLGYTAWKGEVFSRIDPAYSRILAPGAEVRLRLREVHWGGVPLDGIPAIDDPSMVFADEARFMRDTDTVFGARIGGEHRAWPVKVLSWHELLNDTVDGQPVTLSFCTLCGSGILYSAVDERGRRLRFGTSGLLYRSNKLMFDRESLSLWSNLTGEAVVGPRAVRGSRLQMLPMTLTRWDTWRQRHPDTTIMAPDPEAARRSGYRYVEGAADTQRSGVEFPVWRNNDALARNERIYALRIGDEARAYPLEKVQSEGLVHDTLGGVAIVLVADPESGAVRAWERAEHRFERLPSLPPGQLRADDGSIWWVGENNLAEESGAGTLPRVPGHVAFWFGWYAFYPETSVY